MRIRSSRLMIAAFLCMMIGLLILGLVAPSPGSAQSRLTPIDDLLEDFDDGLFNRTQLVNSEPGLEGSELETSEEGAIQLALFGTTPEWRERQDFNLPIPLTNLAAAEVRGRIYIFGGAANTGAGGSLEPQSQVWSAAVNADTLSSTYGELIQYDEGINNWREEAPLPEVAPALIAENAGIEIAAAESAVAVAAVNPDADGDDYIYVMGGSTGAATRLSSYATRIAKIPSSNPGDDITTTGVLTWTAGPNIPIGGQADAEPEWGIEDSSAVSIEVGGNTYIYLIGGMQVTTSDTSPRRPLPTVIYARVDWANDGMLVKPSNPSEEGWERLDAIPVDDPNTEGLWNAVAFVHEGINIASFPREDNSVAQTNTAIYVMGGELNEEGGGNFNSKIYRALVDPQDGSLYWTNSEDVPEGLRWDVGRLPTSLYQHAGVTFRGSIYIAGGREGAATLPVDRVLAGYFDDRLEVANLGTDDTPSYFLNSDEQGMGLRGGGRAGHATVAVSSDDKTGAVMYVLGGTGTDDGNLLSTVNFAPIGQGLGVEGDPYAPEGTYLSNVYEIDQTDPILQRIVWNVQYPEEALPLPDVQIEYRVAEGSPTNGCINAEWSDWITADGVSNDGLPEKPFSQDGENIYVVRTPDEVEEMLEDPDNLMVDRCFQYQATLERGGDSEVSFSPSLLDINLELYSSSSPDLYAETIQPKWIGGVEGNLENIEVVIRNEYLPDPPKTLAAYAGEGDKDNNFFVTMFVIPEGQTVFTPTLPLTETVVISGSEEMRWQAFAQVRKRELEAPPTEPYTTTVIEWYDASVEDSLERISVTEFFTRTGSYRVCVGVDAFVAPDRIEQLPTGEVIETLEGAEDNNFSCSDPFTVATPSGVTIQATDGEAEIDGSGTGEFLVRYNGDSLDADLQVELAIVDGPNAANEGSDYELLVNDELVTVGSGGTFTVVIPQDEERVSIVVRAVTGTSAVNQTVDLEVQDIGTYEVGNPDSATVELTGEDVESDIGLSSEALTFVITRTNASAAIDVNFTLAGSAVYGNHYTVSGADVVSDTATVSGTVSMSAGQDRAVIVVSPQDGAIGEVELILATGDRDRIRLGYVVYLPWVDKTPL